MALNTAFTIILIMEVIQCWLTRHTLCQGEKKRNTLMEARKRHIQSSANSSEFSIMLLGASNNMVLPGECTSRGGENALRTCCGCRKKSLRGRVRCLKPATTEITDLMMTPSRLCPRRPSRQNKLQTTNAFIFVRVM